MAVRRTPYALVVDDNPVILLHAADIFTGAGFSVFAAADCNEALALLAQHGDRIALLFTNVEIPGSFNGFKLARDTAIRWPSMAILVSSGHIKPDPGDLPRDAIFVPKPFTDEALQANALDVLAVKDAALLRSGVVQLEPIGVPSA